MSPVRGIDNVAMMTGRFMESYPLAAHGEELADLPDAEHATTISIGIQAR
jgi:hypothetical protein